MTKDYRTYGERRTVDGEVYYSQGCCSDGMEEGWVFKDERAFAEQPDEVCYIPEHAFDDVEPTMIDGERFYPANAVGGYTRRQLEELVKDEVDEDGDTISVEYFFESLFWCFPETRLCEMTY